MGNRMKKEDVKYIVVHCSDSPQGRGDNAETIHNWHMQRGWNGIGYHYIILESGKVEYGRPDYWIGSHVKNYNHKSLGICLIGQGSYTEEQYNALGHLIKRLVRRFPNGVLVGHRDLDSGKTCPMFDVREWWSTFGVDS